MTRFVRQSIIGRKKERTNVMEQKSYRPAWIEINLSAIQANIHELNRRLSSTTKIFAVVKANGYGHGDIQVAKAAIEAGASALAVALMDEAVRLREAGITVPILVLGWVSPEYIPIAIKHNIMLTVFQKEWLTAAKQIDFTGELKIHIKLDTGMGRLGMRTEQEIYEFMNELDQEHFRITGLFTHFATADEAEESYYLQQSDRFEQLAQVVRSQYSEPIQLHTGNSAASIRFPDQMLDYVRFGIGMYGLYPSSYMKKTRPFPLRPALSLHAKLIHVKKIEPGSKLSYGATYTAEKEEWIGTIPLGYADGIQRKWQGLDVLIDGKRMPLVGRICMDQCMVKLDQPYPVGTQVTFVGKQKNEQITLEEIAHQLETINYEIACLFTNRIPRYYH